MSEDTVTFHVTPGYGEMFLKLRGYSQAVRIGNRVETSGQGGWRDDITFPEVLEDEIVQAFDNVGRTLAEAGASWQDVVHINSYHRVPAGRAESWEEHNRVMVEQMAQRLGGATPVWTETGVTVFADPAMRVELRVTAVVR